MKKLIAEEIKRRLANPEKYKNILDILPSTYRREGRCQADRTDFRSSKMSILSQSNSRNIVKEVPIENLESKGKDSKTQNHRRPAANCTCG